MTELPPLTEIQKTALYAMDTHNIEIFDAVLEQLDDLDAPFLQGFPLMPMAIDYGFYEGVKHLLDKGANPDVLTPDERTPLHYAAFRGDFIFCDMLLEKKANPNLIDKEGIPPLVYAVEANSYETVAKLLEYNANPNCQFGEENLTPLYRAVEKENIHLLALLRQHGADANLAGKNGQTPLHFATAIHFEKGVKYLLTDGNANINAQAFEKETALHIAVKNENQSLIQILIQADANPFILNQSGKSPIDILVENQKGNLLKTLFDNYPAHKTKQNEYFNQLLLTATWNNDVETINVIAPYCTNINYQNNLGETALHIAASNGFTRVCKALVQHGANINLPDNIGLTPLMEAVRKDFYDYAKEISPAELKRTQFKRSYPECAMQNMLPSLYQKVKERLDRANEIVDLFLNRDDRIYQEDRYGKTAFQYAVLAGNNEIIQKIYKAAHTNAIIENLEVSDLSRAVERGDIKLIEFCLDNGFHPNNQNELGNTLLHLATQHHKNELAKFLLSRGADPEIRNHINQSVFYICEDNHYTGLEDQLRSFAKKSVCRDKRKQISGGPDKQKILALQKIKELRNIIASLKEAQNQKN